MIMGWDTGALPSIIKKTQMTDTNKIACPVNTPWHKKDNWCMQTKLFATLDNTKLPTMWFKLTEIPTVAPFDGLIGSNFYMRNSVYFDFDNQIIYIQK